MPDRLHAPGAVRLARGCWLPAEQSDDLLARCAAAVAVSADDTVIASVTAARVHQLWLPVLPDQIHLACARPATPAEQMTRNRRPEFRAHRRQLGPDDRTTVCGLPVMSLARTWLDLAALLPVPDLVAAGDSVLRSGGTLDELAAAITRSRHVRGVRRARVALPLLDARSRSRPESHLRVATRAPGLPVFQVNEPVYRRDGGWLAEPDLSLPEARIALEYQGEDHAALPRMRKDITRTFDLQRERWVCLYFGPAEVFGRPWQIAPELRRLIAERAPALLRPPAR